MEVKLYHNVFSLRCVASCHPQCRCDGDPSFSSGRMYSILYTVYVNRCRCDVDFLQVKGLLLFVRLFRCSGLREMYIHWSSYKHRIACISGFIPQHMYLVKLYLLPVALGGQTVSSHILPVTLEEVKLYHNNILFSRICVACSHPQL
jgi:hypothetical protein